MNLPISEIQKNILALIAFILEISKASHVSYCNYEIDTFEIKF